MNFLPALQRIQRQICLTSSLCIFKVLSIPQGKLPNGTESQFFLAVKWGWQYLLHRIVLRWVHTSFQLTIILSLWPLLHALVWPPVAMSVVYELALLATADCSRDKHLTLAEPIRSLHSRVGNLQWGSPETGNHWSWVTVMAAHEHSLSSFHSAPSKRPCVFQFPSLSLIFKTLFAFDSAYIYRFHSLLLFLLCLFRTYLPPTVLNLQALHSQIQRPFQKSYLHQEHSLVFPKRKDLQFISKRNPFYFIFIMNIHDISLWVCMHPKGKVFAFRLFIFGL